MRHATQGVQGRLAAAHIARSRMAAQQQFQVSRMGELRRTAEAAEVRIVDLCGALNGKLQGCGGEFIDRRPRDGARRKRLEQFGVLLLDVAAALAPGFRHTLAQVGEAGQAVARRLGKIRATEEGRAFRREEHGEWPAARPPGQHLVGGLVDLIKVGPLLAVYLDVHEQSVHHCCDFGILEGFMGHDMAPVAGGIADGKQNGLAFLFGQGERFLTPRTPIHGVVCVLLKIGRSFAGQKVGHGPSLAGDNLKVD